MNRVVPHPRWADTFQLLSDSGELLYQGGEADTVLEKKRHDYADTLPPCAECNHEPLLHLSPGGTSFMRWYTYAGGGREVTGCLWSSGWSGSDWCSCHGYRFAPHTPASPSFLWLAGSRILKLLSSLFGREEQSNGSR